MVTPNSTTARLVGRRGFLRRWAVLPASLFLASACSQPSPGGQAQGTPATASAPPVPTSTPTVAPESTAPATRAPATHAPHAASDVPTIAAASATAAPPIVLAPTPECADDDDPTPAQTEGPYFTPNAPERTSLLENGLAGTKMVLAGYVLSTGCQPVSRALVDFWQGDDDGEYDNRGFRLRGHQFTAADGRYTLETVVPGLYPGRTRHIHVKVQAPNRPVLTTQLYFPNEAQNRSDGIFHPSLVIDMQDAANARNGSFDFVLDLT